MKSIIRSNRFNYNPDYIEPRFYSFSTWADDITRYFASSSGVSCAPCMFLAFKCDKPVGNVIGMLENYFENKLAHLRNEQISNPESSACPGFAPLKFLLDGLKITGTIAEDTRWICEDISEQNYNGAFTDFLCTVPHGFSAKLLEPESFEALKSPSDTGMVQDWPFGWYVKDEEREVPVSRFGGTVELIDIEAADEPHQDDIDSDEPAESEPEISTSSDMYYVPRSGWNVEMEGQNPAVSRFTHTVDIIYDDPGNKAYTVDEHTKSELKFIDTEDVSVDFNCIIPLYRCYGLDAGVDLSKDSNSVKIDTEKLVPLGIWFNHLDTATGIPKTVSLVTGNAGKKYTTSWTLTVSVQIKPYYASNSFPIHYSDDKDLVAGMSTFAQMLSGITDLSRRLLTPAVNGSSPDMELINLRNRISDIENALNQIKGQLGFEDIVHHIDSPSDSTENI